MLRIERKEMLRVIRHERTFAAFFLDYLLARITRYQEVIMDQLFDSAEKRLARTLLLLANFGNGGKLNRSFENRSGGTGGSGWHNPARVSLFMNR
jgi:hypothetical protein